MMMMIIVFIFDSGQMSSILHPVPLWKGLSHDLQQDQLTHFHLAQICDNLLEMAILIFFYVFLTAEKISNKKHCLSFMLKYFTKVKPK